MDFLLKEATFVMPSFWESHLFQVDAFARGVWASDDFDSALWFQALEGIGHKDWRAQL